MPGFFATPAFLSVLAFTQLLAMIDHAGLSEQGHVRFRNEDFITHQAPGDTPSGRAKGFLCVVADGVGGSGAGDVASREAAQMLTRFYYEGSRRPERALRDAISRANLHVYDLGLKAGSFRMESTLAVLAVTADTAYIAHVGDSRVYRVRQAGQIQPMTRDHSEVAELVRMQILTPENARHHPRRHIITRSVGNQPIVQSSMRVEPLELGDTFVLCTDGLWEPLEDAEIAEVVRTSSPADACQKLVALALERQSTDNLSVQIVRVTEVDKDQSENSTGGAWYHQLWYHKLRAVFGARKPGE